MISVADAISMSSPLTSRLYHTIRQLGPPDAGPHGAGLVSSGMGVGSGNIDTSALLNLKQKQAIQYVSVFVAALSVLSCLVSLYWFLVMRRNFRRTLIMLLVISDLFKSTWFMVFPAVSLSLGGVKTGSAFCDIGGFFLQAGIESCDIAVLLMSLHMSLQVLNPTGSRLGPDGLYRYRYTVIVLWIMVPCFMAGLAFVHGGSGSYLSQGAFCTLPIRPFWYRLALSWIPRYLVLLYIFITAIRIYIHVGSGFSVFAREVSSGSNKFLLTRESTWGTATDEPLSPTSPRTLRKDSIAYMDMAAPAPVVSPRAPRRPSVAPWDHDMEDHCLPPVPLKQSSLSKASGETLASELRKAQSFEASNQKPRRPSHFGLDASQITDFGAAEIIRAPGGLSGETLVRIVSTADAAAKSRKRAIQRQTRLLFIYPCAYMIWMIIPFVQHCFNYSDYYAQHPVFVIAILGPCCYSSMGIVDCIIFGWRERPWKNIPGSDETFLGSFLFWRFLGPWAQRRTPAPLKQEYFDNSPPIAHGFQSRTPLRSLTSERNDSLPRSEGHGSFCHPFKHGRPSMGHRTFTGLSDSATRAAEHAAERLALERQAHFRERQHTLDHRNDDVEIGKKDWFDRSDSWVEEEQEDDDAVDGDSPSRTKKDDRRSGSL